LARINYSFALDQTTKEHARQEIQLASTGIKNELKGWMTCDAMEHVYRDHSMSGHA
jgi:hypothetical protein